MICSMFGKEDFGWSYREARSPYGVGFWKCNALKKPKQFQNMFRV